MYSSTKFQLIWKTSNFEHKFVQKNLTDKKIDKINIKIIISILQCIPVHNSIHFIELQIMRANLPKKYD